MTVLFFSLAYAAAAIFGSGGGHSFMPSLEYMAPTKSDRPIQTLTSDLVFGRNVTANGWLSMGGGLTLTHAWGEIHQLEGRFEEGTLRSVTYANTASGAGLTGLLRFEPLQWGKTKWGIEVLGGVLLYTPPFPAGGRSYNFMGRIGPTFAVAVSENTDLRIAAHWMHVSNGQGMVPHNPSYEGIGASVGCSWRF